MDARRQRSRDRLASAILELAGERDAGALTVSEVAERAAVHRSTFYEHASSPTDLLQSVLREELDALRAPLQHDEEPDAEAVTAVTRGVLEHVDSHAAIYVRGLATSGLHELLAGHFVATIGLLARRSTIVLPCALDGVDDAVVLDAIARFIAEGVVGLIEVWLTTAQPRDPDWFLKLYAQLVPAWWPISRS